MMIMKFLKLQKKILDIESIKNIYFDKKVSSILEANTSDAFKNDIFGVPTFFYNGQVFGGKIEYFS